MKLHFAKYPIGSFYKRHLDQFSPTKEKRRKISFILYLNKNWQKSDGGELKLYAPETIVVEPAFGKMIFFLSEEFEHEVLTTNRERFSLTGWMYQY